MSTRLATLSLGAALLLAGSLLAACGGSGDVVAHSTTTPAGGPRTPAELFDAACARCHGPKGEGGLVGAPLNGASAGDRQAVVDAILNGVGAMPPSWDGLDDEQIQELADYVAGLP